MFQKSQPNNIAMNRFTDDIQYNALGSDKFEITNQVRFYLRDDKTGYYIELPEGTITNFASIPVFMQWLFPHDHEDYKMAAAFHDHLVGEFGGKAWVMIDEKVLYEPSWQESAFWFKSMMEVRQRYRRRNKSPLAKIWAFIWDLKTRWIFWLTISIYGLIR